MIVMLNEIVQNDLDVLIKQLADFGRKNLFVLLDLFLQFASKKAKLIIVKENVCRGQNHGFI